MVNVLPPRAKKELLRLNRAHFVLVGSIAALVGALLAFLALLPAYTITLFQHNISEVASTAPLTTEDENERAELLRSRSLVRQFSPIASGTNSSFEAIMAALEMRPEDVLIQNIRYTRDGGSMVIRGIALNRADIIAYRDLLSEDARFENVSVPASDLAGNEGGQFSMTLTGAF
jgi:hypothetical protein